MDTLFGKPIIYKDNLEETAPPLAPIVLKGLDEYIVPITIQLHPVLENGQLVAHVTEEEYRLIQEALKFVDEENSGEAEE